jgi:FkbM family methyltransferase
VFDVGLTSATACAFASLGCRVVAVEPQPFREGVARCSGRIVADIIVQAAIADVQANGAGLSERTPPRRRLPWHGGARHAPTIPTARVRGIVRSDRNDLDKLIETFGVPAFMKIDVEGSEPAVLAGLGRAVPALSFEYLPRALDEVRVCVARLDTLGGYRFNWSVGESSRLALDRWVDATGLLAGLRSPDAQRRPGDVYARLS